MLYKWKLSDCLRRALPERVFHNSPRMNSKFSTFSTFTLPFNDHADLFPVLLSSRDGSFALRFYARDGWFAEVFGNTALTWVFYGI